MSKYFGLKDGKVYFEEGGEIISSITKNATSSGIEKVVNGGFEEGTFSSLDNYTMNNEAGASIVRESAVGLVNTGSYSAKMTLGASGTDYARVGQSATGLTEDDSYAFSVWARRGAGLGSNLRVALFNDVWASATAVFNHNTQVWDAYTYPNALGANQYEDFTLSESFVKYSLTQNVTVPASTNIFPQLIVTGSGGEIIYVDDLSLANEDDGEQLTDTSLETWGLSGVTPSSWTITNTGSSTAVLDSDSYAGNYCLLYTADPSVNEASAGKLVTGLTSGTGYTVSYYAKNGDFSDLNVYLYNNAPASATEIYDFTANGWVAYTYPNAPTADQTWNEALTTSYAQKSDTLDAPATNQIHIELAHNAGASGHTVYLDNVSIVENITQGAITAFSLKNESDESDLDASDTVWEARTTGGTPKVFIKQDGTGEVFLNGGAVGISGFIDDDGMSSATDATLATSESIKAYVDEQIATTDTLAEILAIGNSTGGTDISITSGDSITGTGAIPITPLTVSGTINVLDGAARTAGLLNVQGGSDSTPVTTDNIAMGAFGITSTGTGFGLNGTYTSDGITAGKLGAGVYGKVLSHASDNALGVLAGLTVIADRSGGTTAPVMGLYIPSTSSELSYLAYSNKGANILAYNAINDGSPSWIFGSGANEKFEIQTVYDSGAQTIDYVNFKTYTASATANKGKFIFLVDEAGVLEIYDSGINMDTGKAYQINETSVLDATTLGSGVVSSSLTSVGTIGTGVWQGTAIADGYIASAATWNAKIANVVEDTTPQLGGNLDVNSNQITSSGDIIVKLGGNDGNQALRVYDSDSSTVAAINSDGRADVLDLAINGATPTMKLIDTDAGDEDVSAQIFAQATDTGSGTEDVDVTFQQQVAGTLTTFLTSDADGSLTLGQSGQGIVINGDVDLGSKDITGTATSAIKIGFMEISTMNPRIKFFDTSQSNDDAETGIIEFKSTDNGDGTEDADFFMKQMIDGTSTEFFNSDADGNMTLGWSGQSVALNGGVLQGAKGTDLASSNNMAVPSANYCDVTGTTQINTMSATGLQAGTVIILQFDGSVTVKQTTAGVGAQFQLAGSADFSATAGDTLQVVYDGTYWREVSRTAI